MNPGRYHILTDRITQSAAPFRPFHPTARYLARTEVHVFAFSIAASVLLSLFPFLNVMASFSWYVLKWPDALYAIQFAVTEYFPGELGGILYSYIRFPAHIEYVSLLLLMFTANGIFEPLEVALNRAWGVTKDRSYLKNQFLSFLLILLCGALALTSFLLTAINREYLARHFGVDGETTRWAAILLFRLVAVTMTMLALFLTYWLLPNCRVPVRRIAPVACLVGLALTGLQYLAVLVWTWIIAKMKHDYGPFAHSASIILFSFLASLIVLAGAEWSARRPEKEKTLPVELDVVPPRIPTPAVPDPQAKPLE
ncbi:MAG TPA: YihY/virulence factor BrkB family protein [Bryobacteraceae bacterium]